VAVGLALALLAGLAGWLGVVMLRVETPNGTLVVEINDDEVEARIRKGKLVLSGPDGRVRYTLTPSERTKKLEAGSYTVHVEGADGLVLDTTEFTLAKGGKVKVRVTASRSSGTPAREKPGGAKPPLPSAALEALRRDRIPPEALAAAGGGDPKRAPAGLVAVLGEPQPRQNGFVQALTFSADGRWLASGCDDRTIVLRDAGTGRAVKRFSGHTGAVRGVGFSKESNTLASCSIDGTIRLWRVDKDGDPETLKPQMGELWGMAVSADGRFLAAGGTTGGVKLWKWGWWEAPLKLPDDPKSPLSAIKEWKRNASLALSPDGRYLAVRTQVNKEDAPVYLYETATGRLARTLPGSWSGDERVYYSMWMSFSADGKYLASFSSGKGTAVWEVEPARRIADYPSDQFGAIALSPNNEKVALVRNFTIGVEVYDRASRRKERVVGHGNNDGMSVAFAPDGKTLAAGFHDGSVILWDTSTWERKYLKSGHTDAVHSVEFSSDGRALLSTGHDSTVRVWDLAQPGKNRIRCKIEARLHFATASPDQKRYVTLVAPVWYEPTQAITVWDGATDTKYAVVEPPLGLHRIVFSPDGKLLAGSSWPAAPANPATSVYLWNAETGKQVHRFPHLGDGSRAAPAFSKDGKLLAVASPQQLKILEVASGNEPQTWPSDGLCAVAFHPGGGVLATGHTDGTITWWDRSARKKKRAVTGHTGRVRSLQFTPDGKTLVSSAEDGTIRLWEPDRARAVEVISLGPAPSIDLDPSGKYLAAGSGAMIYLLRIAGR
jgi:WD40 repeat protein